MPEYDDKNSEKYFYLLFKSTNLTKNKNGNNIKSFFLGKFMTELTDNISPPFSHVKIGFMVDDVLAYEKKMDEIILTQQPTKKNNNIDNNNDENIKKKNNNFSIFDYKKIEEHKIYNLSDKPGTINKKKKSLILDNDNNNNKFLTYSFTLQDGLTIIKSNFIHSDYSILKLKTNVDIWERLLRICRRFEIINKIVSDNINKNSKNCLNYLKNNIIYYFFFGALMKLKKSLFYAFCCCIFFKYDNCYNNDKFYDLKNILLINDDNKYKFSLIKFFRVYSFINKIFCLNPIKFPDIYKDKKWICSEFIWCILFESGFFYKKKKEEGNENDENIEKENDDNDYFNIPLLVHPSNITPSDLFIYLCKYSLNNIIINESYNIFLKDIRQLEFNNKNIITKESTNSIEVFSSKMNLKNFSKTLYLIQSLFNLINDENLLNWWESKLLLSNNNDILFLTFLKNYILPSNDKKNDELKRIIHHLKKTDSHKDIDNIKNFLKKTLESSFCYKIINNNKKFIFENIKKLENEKMDYVLYVDKESPFYNKKNNGDNNNYDDDDNDDDEEKDITKIQDFSLIKNENDENYIEEEEEEEKNINMNEKLIEKNVNTFSYQKNYKKNILLSYQQPLQSTINSPSIKYEKFSKFGNGLGSKFSDIKRSSFISNFNGN